jgi:hypothetical protein
MGQDFRNKAFEMLMPRYRLLHPTDEPLFWAIHMERNDAELKEAALTNLAVDVELKPPYHQNITNEAVYEFIYLTEEGINKSPIAGVYLIALIHSRFDNR